MIIPIMAPGANAKNASHLKSDKSCGNPVNTPAKNIAPIHPRKKPDSNFLFIINYSIYIFKLTVFAAQKLVLLYILNR